VATSPEEPFFSSHPVQVEIGFGAPRRQDRVTVAFRALLVLPHVLYLFVLSLVAIPLVIVGWFGAMAHGQLPRWIATYVMTVIAYAVRVHAYGYMLAGEFPSFSLSHAEYPITVNIGASRLSSTKLIFRLVLAIPAFVVNFIVANGLLALSPVIWIVTLILGRTPQSFFSATAATIRYQARYYAYLGLVTDEYPHRLFGDADWEHVSEGFRVSRTRAGEWVTGVIVALGVAVVGWNIYLRYELGPKPNPVVIAAEAKLAYADAKLNNAEDKTFEGCRYGDLPCLKTQERALAGVYERFASTVEYIRFPTSQLARVVVVVDGSKRAGKLLLAASRSKDGGRAEGIDPSDLPGSPPLAAVDSAIGRVFG
jgi:hypothetical protein